ncbi:ROK family protein [Paenibacillus sp. JX-17]|uniref:ROK family protein n=1 Tax=Paenibacillus lacisoli TaxID=3064525 RepID=A0ABT9CF67_9BACL|nr:ROK family protein [Paenibacillus sp. JX-17]MDO7907919.1 ROK family protein [Paenibacillus sp. JX-17]
MKPFIIGVDLGGTNIKAAVLNSMLEPICERKVPTGAAQGSQHVLSNIRDVVEDMLTAERISSDAVLGMGLGIPGLLDPVEGISIFSPNFPEWEHVPVVEEMNRVFAFPSYIDNDVRVHMYGEWLHGAGIGCQNLLLITLGTGLGSAVVANGRMVYGATASAGEIGHMNMYRIGRPCRCGSTGCLGRYVSAVGMVHTLTEKLEQGRQSVISDWVHGWKADITAEMISQAYDLGDPLAVEVMHETGELLGYGLANAINLLNPERILIGGGMAAAGERLLHSVRTAINEHALALPCQACQVLTAQWGNQAGVKGAAAYAKARVEGLHIELGIM